MSSEISNAANATIQASKPNYDDMTLDELMTLVMGERTEVLDQQIRDRIAELDAKNKQLQALNTAVANVSNGITGLDDGDDTMQLYEPDKKGQALEYIDQAEALKAEATSKGGNTDMPDDMADFFEDNNLQQGTSQWDKDHRHEDHGIRLGSNGYDFRHNTAEWGQTVTELEEFAASQPESSDPTASVIREYASEYYKPDGNYSKEDLEKIKETLKTAADNLSSTSQLEMTKLQSMMNKYNQSFELLSNFISKYAQSINTLIGNIRS